MNFNYYLAWLYFDSSGRMSTRLPEGHQVKHVLHSSNSNRYPPALWVLVEAVAAPPSYTPSGGFPLPAEAPAEYRTPPPRPDYQEPVNGDSYDYRETTDSGQNGRTRYPELSPDSLNYVPGIPVAPARM